MVGTLHVTSLRTWRHIWHNFNDNKWEKIVEAEKKLVYNINLFISFSYRQETTGQIGHYKLITI